MSEANRLQSEKEKILDEMMNIDGGDNKYGIRLEHLSAIQKLELEADKADIEKKKLEQEENRLDIEKAKLECEKARFAMESKDPTLFDRFMEGLKCVGPAVISGVFSLVALHHITKNEKEEGLYYGTKGMSFIKKP